MSIVRELVSFHGTEYVALLACCTDKTPVARVCVTTLSVFVFFSCSLHAGSSVLSKPCSVTVANEASKKKVDVIDLTIESSSDEEEDPPAKRKCIFMSETQSSPTKGFVNL